MKYQSVKGMEDLCSAEVEKWQVLESRTFFEAHGFREIRTPILESTELFARSIGEASDIVHKEMYTFQDRGGRSLSLRPEMTAAVVRAALEHNLLKSEEPLFVYYMGPMFRAERPQAGRKRQFHQIGIEAMNTASAATDAELIILVRNYLDWFGLKDFVIKINHLGSEADRTAFQKSLAAYFDQVQGELCEDCQYRLTKNVLRIFDCKNESCQAHIAKAPKPEISSAASANFDEIQALLKEAGVSYTIERRLVRGLDYYTGCVFEVTAKGLGSQDAILAGGRYDGLIEELGGPQAGASGFSIGVERMLTALEAGGVDLGAEARGELVYVAGLVNEKGSCQFYRKVAEEFVKARKRAQFSFSQSSLSNHLKRANKIGAAYVLIVGEDEWKAGEVSLKKMDSGVQKRVKLEQIAKVFGEF